MNVSLTQEFERYVSLKVASGLYQSASEVIRDGLRLMKERDDLHQSKLTELRQEIDLGLEQADRGQAHPFNGETAARIKNRGRQHRTTSDGLDQA